MCLLSLREGILMKLEVFADSDSVANAAAAFVAAEARAGIKARGRFRESLGLNQIILLQLQRSS
jgi:hypothetical protein